ncbi:MAG TPA: ATP-binding protein [Candidatus Limnocylindria bacterium]|nr:ATP-binding protein [Candidatus Limnocylindria bacterium]
MDRLRGPWSLSTRLTLLVLVLTIPVLVILALSYGDQLRERRASELDTATRSARNGATIVDGFLRDIENTTFAMAGVLAGSTRPFDQANYGAYLAALNRSYPEVRAIFLTDPNGRVVAAASGEGIGTDLSSRPYMTALKGGADRVWSGSIIGLQSGDITVAFGRPIRPADGTVRGFVILAFHPERVLQALRVDAPADAQIALIDERGRLIYASDRREPATNEIDLTAAFGVRDALAGRVVPIDGVATPLSTDLRYGALAPIARTGWVLSLTRPLAALERELVLRLTGDAAAVLGTLLVAGLLAAFVANRLARPLRELSRSAVAIGQGERPVIPQLAGGAEVEQLSAAMRSMQAAVAHREDDLRLLATASERLGGSLEYSETLRTAAEVAVPDFADWCVVDVVDAGRISRGAVAHADPAKQPLAQRLHETYPPDVASSRGPIGRAITTGREELNSDTSDEFLQRVARDADELALYRELAPRSYICEPLVFGGQVRGTIMYITAESGRTYTDAHLPLARELARRVAVGIENARLYYEVRQSVRTRDDFLSAVAHELKTPLTVISGTTQLLRRRVDEEDQSARGLDRIMSAVGRMTAFIEELLELVRRQADPTLELQRAPTDLAELVRRVTSELTELSRGQIVEIQSDESVVGEWDAVRLERAIANVLGNAFKYNSANGRVFVRVGVEESPQGRLAFCTVTDEGIGIPEADRARIFDRFARGSNVAGRITGTGVGLTIVRQIVEQHGGTIGVTSTVGRGSTFTIRLPLAAVPAALTAAT